MNWIISILIGFIIGLLARMIKPGNDKMGFILTSIVGILGSLLATYAGQIFGIYLQGEPASFLASIFGAVAILIIIKYLRKK